MSYWITGWFHSPRSGSSSSKSSSTAAAKVLVKDRVELNAFDWLCPVGCYRVFYYSWSVTLIVWLLMSSSFVACPLVIHASILIDGAPPLSLCSLATVTSPLGRVVVCDPLCPLMGGYDDGALVIWMVSSWLDRVMVLLLFHLPMVSTAVA